MNQINKKILVFDKFIGYNIGGAQKSLHRLLNKLNFDFVFLGCKVNRAFNASKYLIEDLPVERFLIREFKRFPYFEYWFNRCRVRMEIEKRKEDILFTQGLWGGMAVRFFKRQSVYFIRDEYQLNKIGVYQIGIKKIIKYLYLFLQLPFILIMFWDNKKAIHKATVVIANSKFIRDKIMEKFGVEAKIIYPLVDIDSLKMAELPSKSERQFITLIGSEIIKGREIVEKIAQKMSDYKFMIVGREFLQPTIKENIIYQPWSNDVLNIYKKTRLLLVPSVCDEAFGRTALEALVLGIPVLGSDKGGIPEILSQEYIVKDLYDYKKWQEKIESIFKKDFEIDTERFSEKLQLEEFRKIIVNNFAI